MFNGKNKIKWGRIAVIVLAIGIAAYFSFNKVMSAMTHNKKEVIVPNVVKKTLDGALAELSSVKLAISKGGDEYNMNVPPGVVLRQNPPAGMKVREGKVVKVYVSRGGETISVPDLSGMSVRNADIALKNEGLTLGEITKRYSETVTKDGIIDQDPLPGTSADEWALVNVSVSEGQPPDNVKLMPNFLGKTLAQAREIASKNSIKIDIKNEKSNEPENTVIRQAPEPDADITKGNKAVTVYISAK
ncbi:MAG: PASTA domain-containing protein [Elusimicrobiota bacterium]|jgi:serine/threonine-protein kinase|nr:PASTA domain-containing protein [Elusimicrobiota bacterium]